MYLEISEVVSSVTHPRITPRNYPGIHLWIFPVFIVPRMIHTMYPGYPLAIPTGKSLVAISS